MTKPLAFESFIYTLQLVAVDFTLKELKTLRIHQRYPFRDQQYNGESVYSTGNINNKSTYNSINQLLPDCAGKYSIITFEEFIAIALEAPRVVGIYPEIKDPVFINRHVSLSAIKPQHRLIS